MAVSAPDVRIRRATRDDAEAVARLNGQLGYPSTAEQVRARFATLDQGSAWTLIVAAVGDAVAGYVTCCGYYTIQRDPCAEIGGLIVDERYRGRRIGALLVAAAEEWARENDFPAMILHSNIVRTDAHRFYEALGYGNVKSLHYFHKEIGPA